MALKIIGVYDCHMLCVYKVKLPKRKDVVIYVRQENHKIFPKITFVYSIHARKEEDRIECSVCKTWLHEICTTYVGLGGFIGALFVD